jgi:hypothetical protein
MNYRFDRIGLVQLIYNRNSLALILPDLGG